MSIADQTDRITGRTSEASVAVGEDRTRRAPDRHFRTLLLLLAGISAPAVIGATVLNLRHFSDVGYPDSAILLTARLFAGEGTLYPSLAAPPYNVTVYGPLLYTAFALAHRVADAVGMRAEVVIRIVVVLAFVGCMFSVFRISGLAFRKRTTAWLAVVLAVGVLPFAGWTTQLRPDFPALLLVLASLALLLGPPWRGQVIVAAVLAGAALLIKQTFVALPVAVFLTRAASGRRRDAVAWMITLGAMVGLGYGTVWLREPMISHHLAALRHPFLDYGGAARICWEAVQQPVVPLGLAGFFCLPTSIEHRRLLRTTYVLAWAFAAATVMQVGANINYFWEPFVLSALFAAGLVERLEDKPIPLAARTGLAVLTALLWLPTLERTGNAVLEHYRQAATYRERESRWIALTSVVRGRPLLATIPSLTAVSDPPAVPDPFLNSMLQQRGKWHFDPVLGSLRRREYDAVITRVGEEEGTVIFRGIVLWPDAVWRALHDGYEPLCQYDGLQFWLREGERSALAQRLSQIGCVPPPR